MAKSPSGVRLCFKVVFDQNPALFQVQVMQFCHAFLIITTIKLMGFSKQKGFVDYTAITHYGIVASCHLDSDTQIFALKSTYQIK